MKLERDQPLKKKVIFLRFFFSEAEELQTSRRLQSSTRPSQLYQAQRHLNCIKNSIYKGNREQSYFLMAVTLRPLTPPFKLNGRHLKKKISIPLIARPLPAPSP